MKPEYINETNYRYPENGSRVPLFQRQTPDDFLNYVQGELNKRSRRGIN